MAPTWLTCPRCNVVFQIDKGRPSHCPACQAPLPIPASAAAEAQWHYAQNRQKTGPVPWMRIRELAANGLLQRNDMLLQAGTQKWIPAAQVPGLFPALEPTVLDSPGPTGMAPLAAVGATDKLDSTLAGSNQDSGNGPALPGVTVAGYQVLSELGRGGMGVVYKARHISLKRLVALKMVLAGEHAGETELARFRAEAEAAARLQHPNIVQIYEVGEQAGRPYFSLEYVDGGGLDHKLNGRPIPPREAAQLLETVARAVHAAHQQGIIHRDLKPANILLTRDGTPKITDFGLAKQLDVQSKTATGALLGTPSYMAPEQGTGKIKEIGPPTDVWSLGVILYETLTGGPPFRGETAMDTIMLALSQEPVPPSQLQPKVPRDLETICLKCLNKEPAKRYPSALDLADDLHRFLHGEPILARPAGKVERFRRWCRRNPAAAGLLAVVTLLLIAVSLGSAFGLWHLSRLSGELVHSTAVESAAQESEMLENLNSFYSTDIVDRVKAVGVTVTHDYKLQRGAIPIPATLTIELGNHIHDNSKSGMQVRLYSDFPFRSRKDGGPRDDFEREALRRLRENPEKPFYRFEEIQGLPVLRYTTARREKETCVQCHNTHPESTKRDWKVGDVRGVLEIIRPLDRDTIRTRDGLRGTFYLIGVISVSLLLALTSVVVVAGLVFFLGGRRILTAPPPQ